MFGEDGGIDTTGAEIRFQVFSAESEGPAHTAEWKVAPFDEPVDARLGNAQELRDLINREEGWKRARIVSLNRHSD